MISNTNIEMATADVKPFIKNPKELDIWSIDYFTHLADMIKFNKMRSGYFPITQRIRF